ncbi:MAG: FKBP-type peptidyl-prolyl cis-trans isomerase [Ginsengibacter sp.]|jgi:FKBP-type peptidyl-prolyl cis-trans isomerase FklB
MRIVFFTLLLAVTSTSFAQKKKNTITTKQNTAMSGVDSLSYALAIQVAEFYKSQGLDTINSLVVKKAFDDVFQNKNLLITQDQAGMMIQEKMQEFMFKKINATKEEGKKFLSLNRQKPGVVTLPSGLQYQIISEGTGQKPVASDKVKAHYAGTLINGMEFDNSYKRGAPLEISVMGVIEGWTEALQLMPVGSKWKLFIPSELGYGDRGQGKIPGGSVLIFEIELLDIVH